MPGSGCAAPNDVLSIARCAEVFDARIDRRRVRSDGTAGGVNEGENCIAENATRFKDQTVRLATVRLKLTPATRQQQGKTERIELPAG